MFPSADKFWGRREKPEWTEELSGHAQSKEPSRESFQQWDETSRGLQGGAGEAASWKINQRLNTEIQGHAGFGLLSGAAMVLGVWGRKEEAEEKPGRGQPIG